MPSQSPSIQSCFKFAAIRHIEPTSSKVRPGDGFTPSEVEACIHPLQKVFNPSRAYTNIDNIGDLTPGMTYVKVTGKIANLTTVYGRSNRWSNTKGWQKLIIKDNTGILQATLFFKHQAYTLKLGTQITIWTASIFLKSGRDKCIVPTARMSTSLFPGHDPDVHVQVRPCSNTLEQRSKISLAGLKLSPTKNPFAEQVVTLRAFLAGADDVPNATLVFCVKSVASTKIIKPKSGNELMLRDVKVFDDTAETTLKLWNSVCGSADDWVAGKTILMLTNPNLKRSAWTVQGVLELGPTSIIDIDPGHEDATWLKHWVDSTSRAESMCQDVPDDLLKIWNIATIQSREERILFTIAQIDEWARDDIQGQFSGFLNLLILDVELCSNRQRNMLLCNECCSLPVYSNDPSHTCKICANPIELAMNPKIIGTLVDETGSINAGKLLWTRCAWQMLFGRKPEDVLRMNPRDLKELEVSLLFVRITLIFGWSGEVGKIVVLGVCE